MIDIDAQEEIDRLEEALCDAEREIERLEDQVERLTEDMEVKFTFEQLQMSLDNALRTGHIKHAFESCHPLNGGNGGRGCLPCMIQEG